MKITVHNDDPFIRVKFHKVQGRPVRRAISQWANENLNSVVHCYSLVSEEMHTGKRFYDLVIKLNDPDDATTLVLKYS